MGWGCWSGGTTSSLGCFRNMSVYINIIFLISNTNGFMCRYAIHIEVHMNDTAQQHTNPIYDAVWPYSHTIIIPFK